MDKKYEDCDRCKELSDEMIKSVERMKRILNWQEESVEEILRMINAPLEAKLH